MHVSAPVRRATYTTVAAVIAFSCVAGVPRAESPPKAEPPHNPPDARLPDDAVFKEAASEIKDRHRFNDFSWREFIALNWPAAGGVRNEPDKHKKFGADAPAVVWNTWKSLDELFPPDPRNTPPTEWDSFDAELAALWPARGLVKDAGKKLILSQVTRLGTVSQAGFSAAKLPPLIAQNGTYVRYEVRVNKTAYEFIRNNRYYLRDVIRDHTDGNEHRLAFPDGSIIVKAAWMELKGSDVKERFYHVPAEVEEWSEGTNSPHLRPTTVGLVGLHIAHKTPQRPSWIWSTFEHVDNTEPGPGATRASFTKNVPEIIHALHNVDEMPPPLDEKKPLPVNPKPVDVERANAIHPTTHNVTMQYHKSAKIQGTVWQNYRLVVTQWVGNPDPGDPALDIQDDHRERIFPKQATNAALETYRQGSSCIHCHVSAVDFRFVFFPSIRAYPPKTDP